MQLESNFHLEKASPARSTRETRGGVQLKQEASTYFRLVNDGILRVDATVSLLSREPGDISSPKEEKSRALELSGTP